MKRRERLIPKFQSSFTATSGTTFMLLRKPIRDITITRQSVLATVVVMRDAPERKDTSPADSRHRTQPTVRKDQSCRGREAALQSHWRGHERTSMRLLVLAQSRL